MFVKWECGCKGFVLDDQCWVIDSCDGDGYDDALAIYKRDMNDQAGPSMSRDQYKSATDEEKDKMIPKKHTPLPVDQVEELLKELSNLIHEGYKYRGIKHLLS